MAMPPFLEARRPQVEEALSRWVRRCPGPPALIEAMEYSLLDGGKRIRPLLVILAREAVGGEGADPLPAACAIEMIHTYSLIHDDLPAMDDDDLRRGRPTSHRRFGEAMAILAGDALLTHAFWVLASAYGDEGPLAARLIEEVSRAAGPSGMVGGQVLDTLSGAPPRTEEALVEVHQRKTGALIRASVRVGAILGGASPTALDALTRFAEAIGLAFQVVDDILDGTATPEALGKTPGKDARQGKVTFATLLGLEEAQRRSQALTEEAVAALAPFEDGARDLEALATFLVGRRF